ncbi:protein tyrosine phosphatase family protein [Pelatocladus sp. BLCC-F211]|uniref:protein tyrosine phosphatase family protein n=1 Tax=Pelatocladus sp. BLCC-F211 TaxID=3342752 RepID=UPI0035BA2A15
MSHNCIENIYNFLQISDLIATSGQLTEEEFTLIKEAGYQLVVNLALPESPNALTNEKEIVESQEMEYIHIPVAWEKPTYENVKDFFQVMETNTNKKVFVHCAANKRVSVFMYLYRRLCKGINHAEAEKDLHQIWIPDHHWQKFIEQVINYYRQQSKS